jgi:hypothetical protein
LLCRVAQSTTGETALALTSFSGTLFRVLEYYILGTCCCRDDFPCLGMKQRNRQILSAVRLLTRTCPGSRRSRQRSALAWVDAGEHGPCGGLRVPTPSTASEKALPAIASSPPTLAAALETARAPSAPLSAADCLRLVEALQSVPDPRRARAVVTVGNRCLGLLCRR